MQFTMSLGQCCCLECGTILRVRDASFVGRVIECPDCRTALLLQWNEARELVVERPAVPPGDQRPRFVRTQVNAPAAWSRLADWARSPLVVAWLLGTALTTLIAIQLLRPTRWTRQSPADASVASTQSELPSVDPIPDPQPPAPPVGPEQVSVEVPAQAVESPPVPDTPVTHVEIPPSPAVAPEPGPKPEPAPAPANVPAVPRRDIAGMLQQRLRRFRTDRSLSRLALLQQVEELLDAPVSYDIAELGAVELERSIHLDQEQTTVERILKAIVESADWAYEIEDQGIRIRPQVGPRSTPVDPASATRRQKD